MSFTIKPARLSVKSLSLYIGISDTLIYNKMNEKSSDFDSEFPNPIKEGKKNLWITEEIDEWVARNTKSQRTNII